MDQEISREQNSKSCRRRSTSSVSAVTSGVLQGTVLGPLLFLIYINDMPSTVSSTMGLFADDAYICRSIKNIDDCKILQEDLQKLLQWKQSWLMGISSR